MSEIILTGRKKESSWKCWAPPEYDEHYTLIANNAHADMVSLFFFFTLRLILIFPELCIIFLPKFPLYRVLNLILNIMQIVYHLTLTEHCYITLVIHSTTAFWLSGWDNKIILYMHNLLTCAIFWILSQYVTNVLIRAVAGQRSSPESGFANKTKMFFQSKK